MKSQFISFLVNVTVPKTTGWMDNHKYEECFLGGEVTYMLTPAAGSVTAEYPLRSGDQFFERILLHQNTRTYKLTFELPRS